MIFAVLPGVAVGEEPIATGWPAEFGRTQFGLNAERIED